MVSLPPPVRVTRSSSAASTPSSLVDAVQMARSLMCTATPTCFTLLRATGGNGSRRWAHHPRRDGGIRRRCCQTMILSSSLVAYVAESATTTPTSSPLESASGGVRRSLARRLTRARTTLLIWSSSTRARMGTPRRRCSSSVGTVSLSTPCARCQAPTQTPLLARTQVGMGRRATFPWMCMHLTSTRGAGRGSSGYVGRHQGHGPTTL